MDERETSVDYSMKEFIHTDWRDDLRNAESADSKDFIYSFARPVLNVINRRHLQKQTLRAFSPELVLKERGLPLCARRRWGANSSSLVGKTVLIQGTGSGWDAASWARLRPTKVIAVDMFEFGQWPEIRDYALKEYGVQVEFREASLHHLDFISDESIDLCVSDAVFEHVKNLEEVMVETHRVLKEHGIVYATYGPMWYCAGGDHFARGGLRNVYNHILLDDRGYKEYYHRMLGEKEYYQNGARYIELDLFSRLRTEEYLQIFHDAGFLIDSLILELSNEAIQFRRKFSDLYKQIRVRNACCREDDFIIKANFVRLKKARANG
jgi:ubiquinone/menaquinone biosynthesis C-methylase UbiE